MSLATALKTRKIEKYTSPPVTVATVATGGATATGQGGENRRNVATVASVARGQSENQNFRSTSWRIRYIDGTERVAVFFPAKTREEVLHAEAGAVEAVAHAPGKTPPERPLLEDERTRIRRWLELIGETDPATIAKVLTMAAEDSTARHYYLERFRDWEERAAVAEFDGGLPRQEAERLAAAQSFEATDAARAALRAARQAFEHPTPRP